VLLCRVLASSPWELFFCWVWGIFFSSLSLRVAVLVPVCVSDLGRVPFLVSCLCVVFVAVQHSGFY